MSQKVKRIKSFSEFGTKAGFEGQVLSGLKKRKRKTPRFLNAKDLNASPGPEGSL